MGTSWGCISTILDPPLNKDAPQASTPDRIFSAFLPMVLEALPYGMSVAMALADLILDMREAFLHCQDLERGGLLGGDQLRPLRE